MKYIIIFTMIFLFIVIEMFVNSLSSSVNTEEYKKIQKAIDNCPELKPIVKEYMEDGQVSVLEYWLPPFDSKVEECSSDLKYYQESLKKEVE